MTVWERRTQGGLLGGICALIEEKMVLGLTHFVQERVWGLAARLVWEMVA